MHHRLILLTSLILTLSALTTLSSASTQPPIFCHEAFTQNFKIYTMEIQGPNNGNKWETLQVKGYTSLKGVTNSIVDAGAANFKVQVKVRFPKQTLTELTVSKKYVSTSETAFLRGVIIGSKDDYRETFQFLEDSSMREIRLPIFTEHIGYRQVQYLTRKNQLGKPLDYDPNLGILVTDNHYEEVDLEIIEENKRMQKKIEKYRGYNGRRVRVTLDRRNEVLEQIKHFISAGDSDRVTSILRLTFQEVEVATVVIRKNLTRSKGIIDQWELHNSGEKKLSRHQISTIKKLTKTVQTRLKKYRLSLGEHFSDYNVFRRYLDDVADNKYGKYTSREISAAKSALSRLGIHTADKITTPEVLDSYLRPSIEEITYYFNQHPLPLSKKLQIDLAAEIQTSRRVFILHALQYDVIRKWIGKVIAWGPISQAANSILRHARNQRARSFDVSGIRSLQNRYTNIEERFQELRDKFSGDAEGTFLISFSRGIFCEDDWDDLMVYAKKKADEELQNNQKLIKDNEKNAITVTDPAALKIWSESNNIPKPKAGILPSALSYITSIPEQIRDHNLAKKNAKNGIVVGKNISTPVRLKTTYQAFYQIMLKAEKIGASYGPLSAYHEPSPVARVAAYATLGTTLSAAAYYKLGDPESPVWQAIDALITLDLPL